jgi:uncharacterized protein (UPF0332 family)
MTQISEFRLHRAGEYLKEAEILYTEKIGNLLILTNLYHAMMNCLFALFELEEPGSMLHADIIERFKSEFMQAGIFDKRFNVALDFAFHITHECDCDLMKAPAEDEIDKLFPVVREFFHVINASIHNR